MPAPEAILPVPPPLLVVLSGPSGVGKDAVLAKMRALGRPYHFTVTATTRPRRPYEHDGVDYTFVSEEHFRAMVDAGELLEWARVYCYYYGVPRAQVGDALRRGQDVIIKADVQGAATIKRIAPQGVFIFLAPPSMKQMERRLRARQTEAGGDLEERIRTARHEIAQLPLFDYAVVNHEGRLGETVARVEAIITAEKCRIPPRVVEL